MNKASVSRTEAATLYPRRPATSQWGGVDPIPDEPPLGYEIDQQEATGEIFEQEQSMRNASSPAASGKDAAPSSSGSPTVLPSSNGDFEIRRTWRTPSAVDPFAYLPWAERSRWWCALHSTE